MRHEKHHGHHSKHHDREDSRADSNNAFVKKEQHKLRAMMGDRPRVPREMEEFDAHMSNDGRAAEVLGRALCGGLEDAFPANFNSAVK